jgi:hypothetical protein
MELSDIFFHAAILIPIEFGLLHATPLGGMLAGAFTDLFASMGFEFAMGAGAHAGHAHAAAAAVSEGATSGTCEMINGAMQCS